MAEACVHCGNADGTVEELLCQACRDDGLVAARLVPAGDPLIGHGEGWGVAEELADEPIHDAVDLAWRKGRAVEGTASDIKAHIADEAKRIVVGARRANYGTPENNFERIARFWTAYMQNTGRDVTITAADVSPLMRLMKEARLCETPDHLDSHVDLVGYTLTGAEVNGVKP